MLNITKRISAAFAALIMIICVPFYAFAADLTGQTELTDDADLYTSDVEEEFLGYLSEFAQKTGWNAVIYTNCNGVNEDDIAEYSNNYYAEHYGKETSGVMLTIDMSSRAVDFRGKGDAKLYFSESKIDSLLDDVQYYLSNSNYYNAAWQFIQHINDVYDSGVDEDAVSAQKAIEEKENNKLLYVVKHYGIFIAGVSVIIAVITVVVIKHRYKHNGEEHTYDLHENSRTRLSDSRDEFLTKHVNVTVIHVDDDHGHGGGGTSSHSSGGSSVGGSRSF